MAIAQLHSTKVQGQEEIKETYIKKQKSFLFFRMTHWVKVGTEHIADDIVIATTRKIRAIYLNGEEILVDN